MPLPRYRSRSAKKHLRVTPSGKLSVLYKRKKGGKQHCGICSSILPATMGRSKKLLRLSKTQRRPERKFGGVLCSNCAEALIKQKTRLETGAISREEVSLNHLKYIDRISSR